MWQELKPPNLLQLSRFRVTSKYLSKFWLATFISIYTSQSDVAGDINFAQERHAEHNLQTLTSPDSIFTNVRGFAKVQAKFWLHGKKKKEVSKSWGQNVAI